jgi:peptidoglycan hydrolase-like protein with peptidoglycan-binding domain
MRRSVCGRAMAALLASSCLLSSLGSAQAQDLTLQKWKDGWPIMTQMRPGESDGSSFRVEIAQYLLRARRFSVKVDGNFGPKSVDATRRFQRSIGLNPTGVLNAATWRRLIVTVKPGSRGDAVRAVQSVVYFPLQHAPVDGIFGAQTRRAVEKWQRENKLKPDGVVGPATWRTLLFNVAD